MGFLDDLLSLKSNENLRIVSAILLTVVSIMGTVFNVLVLLSIFLRVTKKDGFLKICCLKSFGNGIVCVGYLVWPVPVTFLNYYFLPHMFDAFMGQLVGWFAWCIGPLSQVLLTSNRISAVFFPQFYNRYYRFTPSNIGIIVCLVIAFLFFAAFFPEGCHYLYNLEYIGWLPETSVCTSVRRSIFLVSMFIIVVFTTVCGVILFLKLITDSFQQGRTMTDAQSSKRRQKHRKVLYQTLVQNSLILADTLNTTVTYHLFTLLFFQFLTLSFSMVFIRMLEGLIMLTMNERINSGAKLLLGMKKPGDSHGANIGHTIWQTLAFCCHILLVPFLPLYIFTGYVILTKTPRIMGSMKWAMFNLHVWTSYVDVLMCSLITPYFFFPSLSGFPIGLLQVLRVPISLQVYLGISSVFLMVFSVVLLFENRYNSLISHSSHGFPWKRVLFHSLNGFIATTHLIPVFLNVPDQEEAKLNQLKKIPCPTEEFFTSPTFVLVDSPAWSRYLITSTAIVSTIMFTELSFFTMLCAYRLYFAMNHISSILTVRLQKSFFIGSIIQFLIPFIFYSTPALVVAMTISTDYYNQVLNNLFALIISLHGFASTIAVLTIHKPYRTYVLSIFSKKSQHRFGASANHSKSLKLVSRH